MNCKVEKSKISGEINCPSNKSYTHRGIFLASLAGNNSKVENVLLSADTKATIEACRKFGAIIEVDNSTVIVKKSIKIGTKVPEINTENSGTTIRIAIGIASLFSEKITLTGDSSIQKRPMQPLLDALTSIGAKGEIVLEAILSVFAKKINEKYVLVNSSQYHKGLWGEKQVGQINYYVHPNHKFDKQEADKMNAFNEKMAKLFNIPIISFDYFVSNYSREIVKLWGYDYMPKIYIPGQTGGVADISNGLVYAGNNSEYYPHELVHLYTNEVYPDGYHFWLNEGFATYMAGSGGYDLDWHIEKLKAYIIENPDFEISFKTLKGYIPNGLHSTEFRYVIGGLLCKKVYESNGMKALFDGLKNVRTDEELYQFIEEKLNVKQADFSEYIKRIVK